MHVRKRINFQKIDRAKACKIYKFTDLRVKKADFIQSMKLIMRSETAHHKSTKFQLFVFNCAQQHWAERTYCIEMP